MPDIKDISSSLLSARDREYLRASIRLGQRRIGQAAPNPSVGALIVRFDEAGDRIVGCGVTAPGGRPHAEVVALQHAGAEAKGATCYVSLEPCAHHGKTPPCVDALNRAGIARVVIGLMDPDPRVLGKGKMVLEEAGVEVHQDVLPEESYEANLGHVLKITEKRPAIHLKIAESKDHKVGRAGEGMVAITSALSRRVVHGMRARADALLVGVGTVLADDPDLTCRLPGMEDLSPERIVLDSAARTPVNAKIIQNKDRSPVRIYVAEDADKGSIAALEQAGATVIRISADGARLNLKRVVEDLAVRGTNEVMVESGPTLNQAFLEAGLVDRVTLFRSQVVNVGEDGLCSHPTGRPFADILESKGFEVTGEARYAEDRVQNWRKK